MYKSWKFWYKLCLGLMPIIAIIIFVSAQMHEVLTNKYPFDVLDRELAGKFKPGFTEETGNWSTAQRVFFVIGRNFLVWTTWANLLTSAFFINSAINHKNEGKGKFDNTQVGIMIMASILLVVFGYNIQLPVTGAVKWMQWYTYISWICEHSIVHFALLGYFIFVYDHSQFDAKKFKWLRFSVGTLSTVVYFLLFLVIGLLIVATNGFPIFGDMSYHGEFPYSFMDVRLDFSEVKGVHMWVEFIVATLLVYIVQTGLYFGIEFSIRKIKLRSAKVEGNEIKEQQKA